MADVDRSGCLLAIFKLFGSKSQSPTALPYKRKDFLLTQAERSLFGVLCDAVGDRYFIFAKVRLADLLWLPKGTKQRQSHFNRVQSKHVDFVMCDRGAIKPLVCVELDDASHREVIRQSRDAFVDAALRAAGLPLVRIRAAKAYNVADVRRLLESSLPGA